MAYHDVGHRQAGTGMAGLVSQNGPDSNDRAPGPPPPYPISSTSNGGSDPNSESSSSSSHPPQQQQQHHHQQHPHPQQHHPSASSPSSQSYPFDYPLHPAYDCFSGGAGGNSTSSGTGPQSTATNSNTTAPQQQLQHHQSSPSLSGVQQQSAGAGGQGSSVASTSMATMQQQQQQHAPPGYPAYQPEQNGAGGGGQGGAPGGPSSVSAPGANSTGASGSVSGARGGGGQMVSGAGAGDSAGEGGGSGNVSTSVMAPLPQHIEAGIMAASTWLLHQGGYHIPIPDLIDSPVGAAAASSGRPDMNSNESPFHYPSSYQQQPPQQHNQHQHQQQPQLRTSPGSASHLSSLQQQQEDQPLQQHHHSQQPSPSQPLSTTNATANVLPQQQAKPFGAAILPPVPDSLVVNPNDDLSWRLAVDPYPFTSGLEGISSLPLQVYHATSALGTAPPAPLPPNMRQASQWGSPAAPHDFEINQLQSYLDQLIELLEDVAMTPKQPHPKPPPAYVHTRIARLATLVRETLASLETRSQPYLDATFIERPPVRSTEMSEAEREMELIRARREVLRDKAMQAKRDIAGGPGVPQQRPRQQQQPGQFATGIDVRGPHPGGPGMGGPRDHWRCHSCGTTNATEWKDGPDGPHSLCDHCAYHYEGLHRKHPGDGDFSNIPPPRFSATAPSMMGMGPT